MSANNEQVGGTHYKDMAVQPWDAMRAWMSTAQFAGFLLGNVIKYAARHHEKGGVEDLRKARHYLDKLIEVHEETRAECASVLRAAVDAADALTPIDTFSHERLDPHEVANPSGVSMSIDLTKTAAVLKARAGQAVPWPAGMGRKDGYATVTYPRQGESLDDAAKRATYASRPAQFVRVGETMVEAQRRWADEDAARASDWPGPDWSQAPEWASWWVCHCDGINAWASWNERPQTLTGGGWIYTGGRTMQCQTFSYPGTWRDSLRKRPQ